MRTRVLTSFTIIVLLCFFCTAGANSSVYETTPIEEEDVKTIEEVDDGSTSEYEANPVEQNDMKTIDEINEGSSNVFEATPIEQDDIKTIDQINQ